MKLIDNVNFRLIDDLKENVKSKSKLASAASSFSIYAYKALNNDNNKLLTKKSTF